MLDKDAIREIALLYTDKVRAVYKPKRIILFGSYVDGDPHEYSDIDIAVTFNDYAGNWLETWANLFALGESIRFDIEPHLIDEAADPSGFLAHIKKTGEILFEELT